MILDEVDLTFLNPVVVTITSILEGGGVMNDLVGTVVAVIGLGLSFLALLSFWLVFVVVEVNLGWLGGGILRDAL